MHASLLDSIKESFQGFRDSIRGMLEQSCRNIILSGCFCHIKIIKNFDQKMFVNSKIIDDDVSFVGKRLNTTTGLVENCGKKGIEKLSLFRLFLRVELLTCCSNSMPSVISTNSFNLHKTSVHKSCTILSEI